MRALGGVREKANEGKVLPQLLPPQVLFGWKHTAAWISRQNAKHASWYPHNSVALIKIHNVKTYRTLHFAGYPHESRDARLLYVDISFPVSAVFVSY